MALDVPWLKVTCSNERSAKRWLAAASSPRSSSRIERRPRRCWTSGESKQLGSGHDRGAGIRVVVGETTGFAHTADLSESGLRDAARAAAASRATAAAACARWRSGRCVGNPSRRATSCPATSRRRRRSNCCIDADDAARSEGSSITQVQVALGDSTRRFMVANSDGLFAGDHQVRTRFNVSCIATGDTGMQTGYRPIAGTRRLRAAQRRRGRRGGARGAARQAITKLDARPAPSGDLPVVLAERLGRHLVSRGLRPRPRGRRDPEAGLGLRRARSASCVASPLGHARRRRHGGGRVGLPRHRRRRPPRRAQRSYRERRADRLHVGLSSLAQGGSPRRRATVAVRATSTCRWCA